MDMNSKERAGNGREHTDPGGPSADVLERALRSAAGDDPTLVYDAHGRTGRARLVVTGGPRRGAEFELREQRTTVGRGADNHAVIPDISVSRNHVAIERHGPRYVVVDQGSGNGTRLNGKSVDRAPLADGDELELGDTLLRFAAGGRSAAEDRGSTLRRRLPIYGVIGVSLVAAITAGALRKQRAAVTGNETASPADETRRLARQRFQEGALLLQQGRFIEARDKLGVAAELDRADPEIARSFQIAQTETPQAQALATARAALGGKDYASARAAAAAVPDDSALSEQAREVQQQIQTAMEQAVRDARARLAANDRASAAALLEPVLAAEPARPEALALRAAIAAGSRRIRASRAKAPVAPSEAGSAPIVETYAGGDVQGAIDLAAARADQDPRAARLLVELRRFDASAKEAAASRQAKKPAEALAAFERAAQVDKALAPGRESVPGREVRIAAGQTHLELARALGFEESSLAETAAHLRAAVEADPDNDTARELLRDSAEAAREVYLRAYLIKDSDQQTARDAFRLVVASLPPGDEIAEKAKRWLDKLEGKPSADD